MFKLNFIVFIGIFALCFAAKYPSDLPRCKPGDGSCLNEVISKVVSLTFEGHKGLNLAKFDPLHIKSLELVQNPKSPVNIQLKFTDCDLIGLGNSKVYKTVGFDKDPHTSVFEVYSKIPLLTLVGPYTVKGNVLILPISGSGNSNFTFENVDAKIKFKPDVIEKNGKQHIVINNLKLDFTTTRLHSYFENLFNGDKALGENMNLFLNENWKDIFNEIKPTINEAIASILQAVMNGPFSKIAYSDLFLES